MESTIVLTPEEKIVIERVMQLFFTKLAAVHDKDAEWTARFRRGDESAVEELAQAACEESRYAYDDFVHAIQSDASLRALQKKKVAEILLGGALK